jgi:cytochrome c553
MSTQLAWSFLIVAVLIAFSAEGQQDAGCAACHGAQGEGNVQLGAPRIAGQPQPYLQRQLEAYADGRRDHPVMAPIAKDLAPDKRGAIAAYYAGLSAPAATAKPAASPLAPRGKTLATKGDDRLQVQACENCHGPGGTGQGGLTPYLAGLHSKYLEAALNEWKGGQRKTDPSLQMPLIGKSLADTDIKALAAYYGSQSPPVNVAASKPPAAKGSDTPTRAGAGTTAAEGVSTSGGEATTGGSQGPGGGGAASGAGPSGSKSGATP